MKRKPAEECRERARLICKRERRRQRSRRKNKIYETSTMFE